VTDGANGQTVEFHAPPDEERDALLLTLRLFVQPGDSVSFDAMTKVLDDPGVSDIWKTEFKEAVREYQERLARVAVETPTGQMISHGDVFTMFLHGEIAHVKQNPARAMFKQWVSNAEEEAVLGDTFHQVIIWTAAKAMNIARASQEELKRHPPLTDGRKA
jgi:hypothetical protein